MIARWLVPQAKRFFIRRIGSHNQNQRTIELAVYLGTLIRRIPPGVVAGFLIVAGFVGALDLVMQTTATETRPLVENFAFRHEPQDSRISVRELSDVSETASVSEVSEAASVSEAQAAAVPLPERKPERVYKVPSGKGATATTATQKRITHRQKKRGPKRQGAMARR